MDLGLPEMVLLAVAALFIFGPNRLPKVAAEAARMLRALREVAASARAELSEAVGPELGDLAGLRADLDPRAALARVMAAEPTVPPGPTPPQAQPTTAAPLARPVAPGAPTAAVLPAGSPPPFDDEAT